MDICVIGAGYVGLVTGACLSYLGNKVIVVDANASRISDLKQGKIPFFEPGLAELVDNAANSKLLEFTENIDVAVKKSQVIFIAVGTPALASGEPDLSQVTAVASQIGAALDANHKRVIVNKSTVPIGSGNWVEMLVSQGMATRQEKQSVTALAGRAHNISATEQTPKFAVVSNPEFLREGSAIADSLCPDRIVIGGSDSSAITLMKELYKPIVEQNFKVPDFCPELSLNSANGKIAAVPFVVTDVTSAELIKYAANAF